MAVVAAIYLVSILVLVDVGLRVFTTGTVIYAQYVSILVLVDVGLRVLCSHIVRHRPLCFNPCFSGCWSSSCWYCISICHHKLVSILVLVDVGLRVEVGKMTTIEERSFNPCFSGCWSSRLTNQTPTYLLTLFQSLF